jgi:hypothetical protein
VTAPSPQAAASAFAPQIQALQQVVNGGMNGSGGSNMIDLSKPLDADDVERIIKALQKQQQQQQPLPPPISQQSQPPQIPQTSIQPQLPQQTQIPVNKSIQSQRPPTLQNGMSNTQAVGTSQRPPYPSLSTTQQPSYPPPPTSHDMQNIPLSSASTTGDMDELFDKFVFDPNLVRDASGDMDWADIGEMGMGNGRGDGGYGNTGGDLSQGQGWTSGESAKGMMSDFLRGSSGL